MMRDLRGSVRSFLSVVLSELPLAMDSQIRLVTSGVHLLGLPRLFFALGFTSGIWESAIRCWTEVVKRAAP